ncbi:hypothetical protein CBOM_05513 [Ceraceosorus bombacis]|uniref:Uncharacterized protein n=1 Tax=Ceraceosorus bombacis TaxID=401625 RepID=A0A0P1BRL0_9BASI|nr:hypothetical protein CBOM_05513 [Ceraceosorus bombacis]
MPTLNTLRKRSRSAEPGKVSYRARGKGTGYGGFMDSLEGLCERAQRQPILDQGSHIFTKEDTHDKNGGRLLVQHLPRKDGPSTVPSLPATTPLYDILKDSTCYESGLDRDDQDSWIRILDGSSHRQFVQGKHRLTVCRLLDLEEHSEGDEGKYCEGSVPFLSITARPHGGKDIFLDNHGRHFATVGWDDAKALDDMSLPDCSAGPQGREDPLTQSSEKTANALSVEMVQRDPAAITSTTNPSSSLMASEMRGSLANPPAPRLVSVDHATPRTHDFHLSTAMRQRQVSMIRSCAQSIPDNAKAKQRQLLMDNLCLWAATLSLPGQVIEARRGTGIGTAHFRFRLHSQARYVKPNINRHFADNLPLTGPYLFGKIVTRTLLRMRNTFAFGHGSVHKRYVSILSHPTLKGLRLPIHQRNSWSKPVFIQKQIKTRRLLLAAPWASLAVNLPAQETSMRVHIDGHDAKWGMCTIASAGHYTGGALQILPAGVVIHTRPILDTVCFPSAMLQHSNKPVRGFRMSMIGFTSEDLLKHYATLPELSDYPVWPRQFWV